MHFLGIDGGGSQTRALLSDASGHILGRGLSGSSNPRTTDPGSVRTHLLTAMREACGPIEPSSIRAAHFGIAGAGDHSTHKPIRRIAREFLSNEATLITVSHDLETALEGGLAGEPGIALVVGTGSACYGRDTDGRSVECGGWGDLVDDVGSGSWLGLRALQACVRQADGRIPPSELMAAVMAFLEIDSMAAFVTRIHDVGLTRFERAQLAPIVLDLFASGDGAATDIVNEAVEALCQLAVCASRRLDLPDPPILLCGGLTEQVEFRAALAEALSQQGLVARSPKLPAAAGALLLAFRSVKIAPNSSILEELRGIDPVGD